MRLREDGIGGMDFDFERVSNPVEDRVPVSHLQFHQCVRVLLVEATGKGSLNSVT